MSRYHQMIDAGLFDNWDVELVDGLLVNKMSKTDLHIQVVDIILELLEDFCPRSEYWVRQELPLTLAESEPEPDVSVVKGRRSELRQSKPTTAEFVVEVAISSIAVDRAKAQDYARADIPEYWIIRPKHQTVEVYRSLVDGEYQTHLIYDQSDSIEAKALPGFSFCLRDFLGAS